MKRVAIGGKIGGVWVASALALFQPLAPAEETRSGSSIALTEARGTQGMVVAVCPHAARVGREILQAGGNAVDAAVAVEFALAVTWPEAGNIGGGGFMLVHPPGAEEVHCVEYRERAPAAATEDMFEPGDGRHTHKIVGVPGTVAGMTLAHEKFGRLEWKKLVEPAVALARDGFEIDEAYAESANRVLRSPATRKGEYHQELIRVYGKGEQSLGAPASPLAPADDKSPGTPASPPAAADGKALGTPSPSLAAADEQQATKTDKAGERNEKEKDNEKEKESEELEDLEWQSGDRVVLPDLADTLQRIADEGAAGFYEGRTADLLVAEMERGNGLITHQDLRDYRAVLRPAVHGTFRGHDIYGPPPPSSGGICLVQMLNVLEHLDLRNAGERFSPESLHLLAETMKRSYLQRARYLGDSDYVAIPSELVEKPYARQIANSIDPTAAMPSESLAPGIAIRSESPSTTHFSVIDAEGLAVSNTTTLEQSWGARIVVQGAGFLLNNEMGDFNWFPGHTDRNGTIGTEPNRIEPGKCMLSSQTPVIVARDGQPVLLTGSPGGRTIINTALQMVLNAVEYGMPLDESMRTPRLHHQWLPDEILVETHPEGIAGKTREALEKMGHRVVERSRASHQGDAHSIAIDPETGEYHGVADWRRNGAAEGF